MLVARNVSCATLEASGRISSFPSRRKIRSPYSRIAGFRVTHASVDDTTGFSGQVIKAAGSASDKSPNGRVRLRWWSKRPRDYEHAGGVARWRGLVVLLIMIKFANLQLRE